MKKVKCYSGELQNHDSMRPHIGIRCYKAKREGMNFTIKDSTEYELINILVHGGKYDSYSIRNAITGKITSAKDIAEILS